MTKTHKTLTLNTKSTDASATRPAPAKKVRTVSHAADPVQEPSTVTVVTKSRSRFANRLNDADANNNANAAPATDAAPAQPKAVVVRKAADKTPQDAAKPEAGVPAAVVQTTDAAT